MNVTSNFPHEGRLAGIDFGTVRIGIAICDYRQSFASPVENYQRKDPEADARRFRQLANEEEIVGFVVGLPISTDGNETAKAARLENLVPGCPKLLSYQSHFMTSDLQLHWHTN